MRTLRLAAAWWVVMILVASCGRIGFAPLRENADGSVPGAEGGSTDAGQGGDASGRDGSGSMGGGCTEPARPDVSTPDHVVGTGTPASCSEAALQSAVSAGGIVSFDCGSTPQVITLTSALTVANDTVVDGSGQITLDGNHATRIFHVGFLGAALTLVGLTLENGSTTDNGGAVLMEGGSLTVFDSTFERNTGPVMSPSAGGGAISAAQNVTVALYGTTFTQNESANGGAIQVWSSLTAVHTTFTMNAATGTGGSTDEGGLGGAIISVGTMADNAFCGVTMANNRAGTLGGAYHRVAIDSTGSDLFEQSNIVGNLAPSAGGLYIQDIPVTLRQVTIANNQSSGTGGGLFYVGSVGPFDAQNVTVAQNATETGLGGGLFLSDAPGTIAFSTIADNSAACSTCWAAAISGGQNITLIASLISDNQAVGPSEPMSCGTPLMDGGNNFQWPVMRSDGGSDAPGALCAAGATVEGSMLGPLTGRTGPAGTFLVEVPQATSPTVGAVTSGCPAVDQLGNSRPTPCTAGAVEP